MLAARFISSGSKLCWPADFFIFLYNLFIFSADIITISSIYSCRQSFVELSLHCFKYFRLESIGSLGKLNEGSG
ncbi:hypothetical protein NMG60_11032179 [Bertholletia excelsa]